MTQSFWTGGPGQYESGLRAHYDGVIRNLRVLLAECTEETQRAEYECRISQTEAECKSKIGEIKKLIF